MVLPYLYRSVLHGSKLDLFQDASFLVTSREFENDLPRLPPLNIVYSSSSFNTLVSLKQFDIRKCAAHPKQRYKVQSQLFFVVHIPRMRIASLTMLTYLTLEIFSIHHCSAIAPPRDFSIFTHLQTSSNPEQELQMATKRQKLPSWVCLSLRSKSQKHSLK